MEASVEVDFENIDGMTDEWLNSKKGKIIRIQKSIQLDEKAKERIDISIESESRHEYGHLAIEISKEKAEFIAKNILELCKIL